MASRLERGLRILLRLQHGVNYDVMKLAAEMSVTRRTIFRDIALLRKMGIPIRFDVGSGHYTLLFATEGDSAMDGSPLKLDPNELTRLLNTIIGENADNDESIRRVAAVLECRSLVRGAALDADDGSVENSTGPDEFASADDSHFRIHRPDTLGDSQPLPEPFVSLCQAITSGEPIAAVDHSGQIPGPRLRFIPLRLTFDEGGWRVDGETLASEPISLALRHIQITSDEPDEPNELDKEVSEDEALRHRQQTCNIGCQSK